MDGSPGSSGGVEDPDHHIEYVRILKALNQFSPDGKRLKAIVDEIPLLLMNLTVPFLDRSRYAGNVAGAGCSSGVDHAYSTFISSRPDETPDGSPVALIEGSQLEDVSRSDLVEILRTKPSIIRGLVKASGLAGCGGAHYPVHLKWDALKVGENSGVLIVNGQEGEPTSFKDRALIHQYPDLVMSGATLTARATGIKEVIVVTSPGVPGTKSRLEEIQSSLHLDDGVSFRIVTGSGLYVCGEETALIAYLEGHAGEPALRPPFPTDRGLFGRPTLVHNVETMAWIPLIIKRDGAWFPDSGRRLKLVSVGGHVPRETVIEVSLGITLSRVIARAGVRVDPPEFTAALVGGPAGGLIPASKLNIPLDVGPLREA